MFGVSVDPDLVEIDEGEFPGVLASAEMEPANGGAMVQEEEADSTAAPGTSTWLERRRSAKGN